MVHFNWTFGYQGVAVGKSSQDTTPQAIRVSIGRHLCIMVKIMRIVGGLILMRIHSHTALCVRAWVYTFNLVHFLISFRYNG